MRYYKYSCFDESSGRISKIFLRSFRSFFSTCLSYISRLIFAICVSLNLRDDIELSMYLELSSPNSLEAPSMSAELSPLCKLACCF